MLPLSAIGALIVSHEPTLAMPHEQPTQQSAAHKTDDIRPISLLLTLYTSEMISYKTV